MTYVVGKFMEGDVIKGYAVLLKGAKQILGNETDKIK